MFCSIKKRACRFFKEIDIYFKMIFKKRSRFLIDPKYIDNAELLLPTRATERSAGYDIRAAEEITIYPLSQIISEKEFPSGPITIDTAKSLYKGVSTLVPTGVRLDLDMFVDNEWVSLRARSGIAHGTLLFITNSVGLVDVDYPEQIYVSFINAGPLPVVIQKNERIAQLMIEEHLSDLSQQESKEKRKSGHNSTGIK